MFQEIRVNLNYLKLDCIQKSARSNFQSFCQFHSPISVSQVSVSHTTWNTASDLKVIHNRIHVPFLLVEVKHHEFVHVVVQLL